MKLDRALLKKILYIMIILVMAPFALEIVLLADVVGAEFAALFAIYYLKSIAYLVYERWLEAKRKMVSICTLLAGVYLFKPRIMLPHFAASSLLLLLTSSLLLSCLMWLPPIYLSSGPLS